MKKFIVPFVLSSLLCLGLVTVDFLKNSNALAATADLDQTRIPKAADVIMFYNSTNGVQGINWSYLSRQLVQSVNWTGFNITTTGAANWNYIGQ